MLTTHKQMRTFAAEMMIFRSFSRFALETTRVLWPALAMLSLTEDRNIFDLLSGLHIACFNHHIYEPKSPLLHTVINGA